MQIDGHVEPLASQAPGERPVVPHAFPSSGTIDDDELVDVRTVPHHGRGGGFHEIGDVCVGEPALQGAHDRRREDDIADEAQADQQDAARIQGSTVASSMSITGMSSLIGYTR